MDEPTAALTERETERLFELVERLRDAGRAIIFISHRLEEIYRVASRVTVLCDGRLVGSALPKEMTQGIDVGAKAEIHALIDRLVNEGLGVLCISSDLPEVLGMADRVLVMHRGRLVAEFPYGTTAETVMHAASGLTSESNDVR